MILLRVILVDLLGRLRGRLGRPAAPAAGPGGGGGGGGGGDKAPVPIVTAIAAAPTRFPCRQRPPHITFQTYENPPDGWAARANLSSFPDDASVVDETREVCVVSTWMATGQRSPPRARWT
jgi:hypothetical protein